MSAKRTEPKTARTVGRRPHAAVFLTLGLVLPMLLGACSALPDWADPAGWFSRDAARLQVAPARPSTQQAEAVPPVAEPVAEPAAAKAADKRIPLDAAAGTRTQPQVADTAGATVPKLTAQTAERQGAESMAAAAPGAADQAELVGVIYFGHGSAALNDHDRKVLRGVLALHRQRGGAIRVVGHASARTSVVDAAQHHAANLAMSWKRANIVAAELVHLGAARDEVHAEARSDAQPVYHEFMPTGEAGNRRAEIFLEY